MNTQIILLTTLNINPKITTQVIKRSTQYHSRFPVKPFHSLHQLKGLNRNRTESIHVFHKEHLILPNHYSHQFDQRGARTCPEKSIYHCKFVLLANCKNQAANWKKKIYRTRKHQFKAILHRNDITCFVRFPKICCFNFNR